MTDDLVKRLRAPTEHEAWLWSVPCQAADRIEKLEAELHHCFHRIEELQAALRKIAAHYRYNEEMARIARKALEGKDD
jgi:hypothetical protein